MAAKRGRTVGKTQDRRGASVPDPHPMIGVKLWNNPCRLSFRVNCVALGPTITDNFRSFVLPADDPTGREYFDLVPMKRGGEPAEVGATVVFLCGGDADFINGTTIECDGGMLPGVLYDAGLKTITDLL